ncbi:MAG: hypothetical protein K0S51_2201 [Bacillales bacterium]|jgi:ribosomal protein L37AE/L43A|nr:hypothetical protein [Bacillales bacterium]
MDFLLFTLKYAVILEVKNIVGILEFDDQFHQLIRVTDDGSKEAFSDPVVQVQECRRNLIKWLSKFSFKSIPIIPLVVAANQKSIIKTNSNSRKFKEMIIKSNYLLTKLDLIDSQYNDELLERNEVRRICKNLITKHIEDGYEILNTYGVNENDIKRGIYCLLCNAFNVKRQSDTWICEICKSCNKKGYIQALNDYILLKDNKITNKEFRLFTSTESNRVFHNIALLENLKYEGKGKNSKYILPKNGFSIPKHSLEKTT